MKKLRKEEECFCVHESTEWLNSNLDFSHWAEKSSIFFHSFDIYSIHIIIILLSHFFIIMYINHYFIKKILKIKIICPKSASSSSSTWFNWFQIELWTSRIFFSCFSTWSWFTRLSGSSLVLLLLMKYRHNYNENENHHFAWKLNL
jgi:hypothetical protein